MKTTHIIKSTLPFILLLLSVSLPAQVSTLYFMKGIPTRHQLNPARQPDTKIYINLPLIPSLGLNLGNNSITLHDVVFPKNINGSMQTITFLHPEADRADFYNLLRPQTNIFAETQLDLFSFGFSLHKSYITVGVSEKININLALPKDLFKLLLYGTPDTVNVNRFDLSKLSINTNAYLEAAAGYSRQITDKLTVGGKVKMLLPQANISTKTNKFVLETSREKWDAEIDGTLNAAIPYMNYYVNTETHKIDSIKFNNSDKTPNMLLGKMGKGFAIDLGAEYKVMDILTVSASLLDLGAITWKNHIVNIPIKGKFNFDGIKYNINDTANSMGNFGKAFADSLKYTTTLDTYTTGIPLKLLIAAEYSVLKDKISIGLLSKNTFIGKQANSELTLSANFFPIRMFNAALSYSLFNGRFSNLGVALNPRLGPLNIYLACDFIPLKYTREYIPYSTKSINFIMGACLSIGNRGKKRETVNPHKNTL